jgi:hypothetical protein
MASRNGSARALTFERIRIKLKTGRLSVAPINDYLEVGVLT